MRTYFDPVKMLLVLVHVLPYSTTVHTYPVVGVVDSIQVYYYSTVALLPVFLLSSEQQYVESQTTVQYTSPHVTTVVHSIILH